MARTHNVLRDGEDPGLRLQAWIDRQHPEEILEPDLPIIDPHHHLWDRASRYLLDELLDDVDSGHNIRATMFMQCNAMLRAGGDPKFQPLGETEFVNGIAAMSASGTYGPVRVCAGIIGFADLAMGAAVQDVLEAHVAIAGPRFRGVRYCAWWDEDAEVTATIRAPVPRHLLAMPSFREGFARLAPLGLTFDTWLFFPQLGELTDLARAFPDTTIVVDHVGGVLGIGRYAGHREEVFAAWRDAIRELSRCPNVVVKLGGLGMTGCGFGFHLRARPPTSEELATAWKPYLETCIEAFGPQRAMFESNFPVDKESCSYPALWNAFKHLTASYSAADKAALYYGTAARIYGLPPL